ncbi:hypothetical protein BKA70DRAFT_1239698 [Coprinopsis sp. MPI-PUGE-AT-0042]|nr:hypothetical protein BKA70DRAFT_1239698 [Coprinopsis sp. MPI-PUGE-AT-0042]
MERLEALELSAPFATLSSIVAISSQLVRLRTLDLDNRYLEEQRMPNVAPNAFAALESITLSGPSVPFLEALAGSTTSCLTHASLVVSSASEFDATMGFLHVYSSLEGWKLLSSYAVSEKSTGSRTSLSLSLQKGFKNEIRRKLCSNMALRSAQVNKERAIASLNPYEWYEIWYSGDSSWKISGIDRRLNEMLVVFALLQLSMYADLLRIIPAMLNSRLICSRFAPGMLTGAYLESRFLLMIRPKTLDMALGVWLESTVFVLFSLHLAVKFTHPPPILVSLRTTRAPDASGLGLGKRREDLKGQLDRRQVDRMINACRHRPPIIDSGNASRIFVKPDPKSCLKSQ